MATETTGELTVALKSEAPDKKYAAVWSAARFLLTGDSESETPVDSILAYPTKKAIRDLFRDYRCTSGGDGQFAPAMTEEDIELFNEAAGAKVALSLMNTPQAGEYARTLVKTKIGPVEETTQDGVVIDTARTWLSGKHDEALTSITCVAAGYSATNNLSLFGLAGPRRAMEERCGSPLYNGNRGWGRY